MKVVERPWFVADADVRWTLRWVRFEAAMILGATLWGVTVIHSSWIWFLALFLVPDVSMGGYLLGPRIGAAIYNSAHLYGWPITLLIIGITRHSETATTLALSWIGHVALDRVVGYGLKLPTGFEYTLLGPIGRARSVAGTTVATR